MGKVFRIIQKKNYREANSNNPNLATCAKSDLVLNLTLASSLKQITRLFAYYMLVQSFRTSHHLSHILSKPSKFVQGYFSIRYKTNEVVILYLIVCIKNHNFTRSKHDGRTAAQENTHCLSDWSTAENIHFPAPAFGFGDHLAMPPCHCHRLISLLSPRHSALSWLPTSEQTPSERKTPTFSLG